MEPLETDALLIDYMDLATASYRTVRVIEDDRAVAELPLQNNGRVEGRQQHLRFRHTLSDDEEMLDIVIDGRDAQGMDLPDRSQGSTHLMDTLDDLPAGIGQYDDFHTIDWLRDIARDRMRHRHIIKKRHDGWLQQLKSAHDAWSGWICVFLVGLAAGTCAGVIDIGATWMSDLKQGVCLEAFWFNMEQCCWSGNTSSFSPDGDCDQWTTWPELLGRSKAAAGSYVLGYFLYIIWAVIFALLAAMLVRVFAPYATCPGRPG